MADVGAQVFQFFRQQGYSPQASAGFVGNFQQESGLNPAEAGGGLDQGQGSRYHPGPLGAQLHGILGELQGGEHGTAVALKAAKTPEEAARIISQQFERPGIPDLDKREAYAAEALKRYAGSNGPTIPNQALSGSAAPQAQESSPANIAGLLAALQAPAPASVGVEARPEALGGAERAKLPADIAPQQSSGLTPAIAKLLEAAQASGGSQATEAPQQASSPRASATAAVAPANAKGADGFTAGPNTVYDKGELPQLTQRLNQVGRALGIKLTGISGYRTPQHSVEVGGFADDPHTKGLASDTEGAQRIPKAVLNRYGLERPFPGSKEADHIQLLGSQNKTGGGY